MGKHRQQTTKKWAPYATTAIALEAATLIAFTYATDSHVAVNPLLAATTSIFVDGTKSVTGNEEGTPFYRMADSFRGTYDQTPGVPDTAESSGNNKFVIYPRSLGPLTGFGDPTYDKSEGIGTSETVKAVRAAAADESFDRERDKIYVVGYSQGAGAVVEALPELENDPDLDGVDIQYVLAANPRRNDGGILTRLPAGVYVPILGVSFGGDTNPQNPDTKVLQVTKQYDGVADAPNYIFNVVADLNAIMGFYYLHSGYYKDIDPTPDPDRSDRIVTYSSAKDSAGNPLVTDVLIKAPVGELPLTMPLLQLGVPRSIVEALDPFLRAVIETGYDRPTTVPARAVPFRLVPPPTRWLSDLQSVAAGAVQTGQALTGTTPPPPNPLSNNANNRMTAVVVDDSQTVVDDPTTANTPTAVSTPPKPNKFEPPHRPLGGWKPGDLLRSIFSPKPKPSDGSSVEKPSSTPDAPPPPPSNEPEDSQDANTASAPAAA